MDFGLVCFGKRPAKAVPVMPAFLLRWQTPQSRTKWLQRAPKHVGWSGLLQNTFAVSGRRAYCWVSIELCTAILSLQCHAVHDCPGAILRVLTKLIMHDFSALRVKISALIARSRLVSLRSWKCLTESWGTIPLLSVTSRLVHGWLHSSKHFAVGEIRWLLFSVSHLCPSIVKARRQWQCHDHWPLQSIEDRNRSTARQNHTRCDKLLQYVRCGEPHPQARTRTACGIFWLHKKTPLRKSSRFSASNGLRWS